MIVIGGVPMSEYEGWELWWRWVLAHFKGASIGIVAGCVVGGFAGLVSLFVCGYYAILIAPLAGWIVFAGAIGWAQQLVLWPYSPMTWTQYTLGGFVIALPVSFLAGGATVQSPLVWVRAGLLGGAVLGVAQWGVLRQESSRAWLWVPANMVAWALGGAAAYAVNAYLTDATGLATLQTPIAFLAPILDPLASAGTAVLIVAAITGFGLLWIQEEAAPFRALLRRQ
jgi:hypothetical protein